ncbi:MAG: DUF167 domain-containing protein [Microthrixaceae bacterium]
MRDRLRLTVHVRPGAARSAVGGIHDGALVVKVASPPADGAANRAVVKLLASSFEVRPGAVELVAGHSARRKVIDIHGDPTVLAAHLELLTGGPVTSRPPGETSNS